MWKLRIRPLTICLVLALLLSGAIPLAHAAAPDAPDATAAPFRVYVSPDGSDADSGLSPASAVRTLAGAHAVLQAAAPTTDVEVRIRQGTYVAPPATWTFLVPGHTVTFLPIDYEYGEGVGGIAGRPVFRGDGTSGFWLTAQLPAGHSGGNVGLRFYYLQVERYDLGGLKIDGGIKTVDGIRRPATGGHNGNTVFGMNFHRLGSAWAGPAYGFGAIDLVNSRQNLIRNNHFVNLENTASRAAALHGVYLAHHSSANTVAANRFEKISGDPIRTRNDSNDNDLFDNVLRRTGETAQYTDWFCDTDCAQRHNKSRECASHGNRFHENDNVSDYSGGRIGDWGVMPGDINYAGGPGCSNDGQRRIRTWDNT